MTDEQDVTPTSSDGSPGTRELDSWGRPRSSRSTKTGPGSRGGLRDPDYFRSAEYWRDYRRRKPDYVERERKRKATKRAERRELITVLEPSFSEALVEMLREECEKRGRPYVARRAMLDNSTLSRLLTYDQTASAATIDAMVAYFGVHRVARGVRAQIRLARERADLT